MLAAAEGWSWDVASIGIPMPVRHDRPVLEPANLGKGWVDFDFERALGRPTKVVNDAVMQALGSYDGGRMLFIGLGTGLGSAIVSDGIAEPLELAHLPFRDGTFEDYVGERSLEQRGKKKWRKLVFEVVEVLARAMQSDYVVIGGGGVKELDELPPNARRGNNELAFLGGFRLWDADWTPRNGRGASSTPEARGDPLRERLLEQLSRHQRARAAAEPRAGVGRRADVPHVLDLRPVLRAPEEALVERERAAVRIAVHQVHVRGLQVGGRQARSARESTTPGSGCARARRAWMRSA